MSNTCLPADCYEFNVLISLTATPEELKAYQEMLVYLRIIAPSFEGPIKPEKSVSMMIEVIDRWNVEDTGAFVSHYGNTHQWL